MPRRVTKIRPVIDRCPLRSHCRGTGPAEPAMLQLVPLIYSHAVEEDRDMVVRRSGRAENGRPLAVDFPCECRSH